MTCLCCHTGGGGGGGGMAKTQSYPELEKGEWSARGFGHYNSGKIKTNRAGKRVSQSFL
jgi:hypothetical protein